MVKLGQYQKELLYLTNDEELIHTNKHTHIHTNFAVILRNQALTNLQQVRAFDNSHIGQLTTYIEQSRETRDYKNHGYIRNS